jgi:imidazole glycerol-phosphate synthase subunit HisH
MSGATAVAVIDYGMGNLRSVAGALEMIGAEPRVTRRPEDLRSAERIILPGVGAFGECAASLRASGMVEALEEEVLRKGKPFYGICVGLQVLAREGREFGTHRGLGWLPAVVQRFAPGEGGLKVPHVGWNEVEPKCESQLFEGLRRDPTFYFVHSYHLVSDDPRLVAAECDYGGRFTAAILRDNIFATQFHPEKSQQNGLRLLENFMRWTP